MYAYVDTRYTSLPHQFWREPRFYYLRANTKMVMCYLLAKVLWTEELMKRQYKIWSNFQNQLPCNSVNQGKQLTSCSRYNIDRYSILFSIFRTICNFVTRYIHFPCSYLTYWHWCFDFVNFPSNQRSNTFSLIKVLTWRTCKYYVEKFINKRK